MKIENFIKENYQELFDLSEDMVVLRTDTLFGMDGCGIDWARHCANRSDKYWEVQEKFSELLRGLGACYEHERKIDDGK